MQLIHILWTALAPQAICLTEHLIIEQIETVKLDQYSLGASTCRQTYKHGGTYICFERYSVPYN